MNISIQKLQTGDEIAFKGFFDEFYQALCVFAYSYVADSGLAADIVQETFVKIWDKRKKFDSILKMKSFLYTTVRNSCLNNIRDQKGKRADLEEISDYTFYKDTVIEDEVYRILYKAIEDLPSQTRKIIELSLDGKKNAEIATLLHIRENSVLTLKKLGYRKLRAALGEYYYLLFLILFK